MVKNRGEKPDWFDLKDECDGISASDFKKIERGIKKAQKQIKSNKWKTGRK